MKSITTPIGSIERILNFIKIRKKEINEEQIAQIKKTILSIIRGINRVHAEELVGSGRNFDSFYQDIAETLSILIEKPKGEIFSLLKSNVKETEGSEEIIESITKLIVKEILDYLRRILSGTIS